MEEIANTNLALSIPYNMNYIDIIELVIAF